jgi:hypothetical protein
MTKDEIFELYKKVQKRDKSAEDMLIAQHKLKYPDNYFHKNGLNRSTAIDYRSELHVMYLHLYR